MPGLKNAKISTVKSLIELEKLSEKKMFKCGTMCFNNVISDNIFSGGNQSHRKT